MKNMGLVMAGWVSESSGLWSARGQGMYLAWLFQTAISVHQAVIPEGWEVLHCRKQA